jgi:hypothetical protein
MRAIAVIVMPNGRWRSPANHGGLPRHSSVTGSA